MMHRTIRRPVLALAPFAALFTACTSADVPPTPPDTPAWLANRAIEERALLKRSPAFADFRFVDELPASGIKFVNKPVDDAGKTYKAVHYDHGSGLAVADVDGDGLVDLYFVSQLGTSELWRNVGGNCFVNVTRSSGLEIPNAIAVGASFADIDNDGDADLFVTTVRKGNRLYENDGHGKFTDISKRAGVDFVGHSSGAVFFDYDGDGLLDLFVTNVGVYTSNTKGRGGYYVGLNDAFIGHIHADRADASILYRNLGGNRFKDVTKETGLVDFGWSGEATTLDANDDGRPDILALNMQGRSRLWVNEGGRAFRDATQTYMPHTPWGAMGVKVFDFNNDGRMDVYVTDMHSDMFVNIPPGAWGSESHKSDPLMMPDLPFPEGKTPFIFGNALFQRGDSGSTAFAEVSDLLNVETYWPWGPSAGDLNADGYQDLFVTAGMNFPFRYAVNSLLLNENGKRFAPAEFVLGVEPRVSLTQPWFQLDCAGADKDSRACVECTGPNGRNVGCESTGNGGFVMHAAKASRSSAMVDLDGDGDLDIVTNEFGAAPQVLISNLTEKRDVKWLKVKLIGTRSNRDAIGARVTVTLANGMRLTQVNDGKTGYLSQGVLPLYYGLGKERGASSLEVVWPSGAKQTVAGPFVAANTVEIVEPKN